MVVLVISSAPIHHTACDELWASELTVAIACPGRAVPRKHLVAWGEALALAAKTWAAGSP